MGLIGIIILVILVISAVLLVLVVLIQDEEGEGIGGIFSGGSSTPFGSRAGNVLTRFTAILATIFFVCAFFLAFINRTPDTGNVIGKAQAQSIQSQDKNWWTPLTGQTATPESPAQPAGASTTAPATQTPATSTQTGGQ
jgi:preprotein translocase subunit SecG